MYDPSPFTNPGQIWQQRVQAYPRSTLTRQISFESDACVTSQGQKTQFLANFDIWGLLYPAPLSIRAKFCVLEQTTVYAYVQISSPSVYVIALWRRTPPTSSTNFATFWFNIFWSAVDSSLRKLNTGAQPQTFSYPMVSQEAQLSLRDRATRACQLKSGKVLHKCRRLVFEKL